MKNVTTQSTYRSPSVKVCEFEEQDVVRTSNGAEVDYQQQGWGSSVDSPFGE